MSDEGITYYENKTSFGYMYSGLMAIKNSAGEPVAVLAVDTSMRDMEVYFWNMQEVLQLRVS